MKDYLIPFVGLKQGLYQYEFEIGNKFFESFEHSPVKSGNVKVDLDLQKQDVLMILNFSLHGSVNVPCDRCLEDFAQPIEGENRIIVKFGNETYEESDEIVVLSRDEYEIDVSQYIYEFINLAIPLKKVHPDDENGKSSCNPEILKKLEEYSATEHQKQGTDPRWSALKNLYKKN